MTFAELFDRGYTKPLHRFIMSHLSTPKCVDDLARRVHARLCVVTPQTLVDEPMQCLFSIASQEAAPNASGYLNTIADVVPEDPTERMALQQQLDVALAQLPPQQAAILLAHKRDGLSYEDLQIKFGLPVVVIEKCISDAKARVRTMSWKDGQH